MCGPIKLWKFVNYIADAVFIIFGIVMIPVFNHIATMEIIKAIKAEDAVKLFGIIFGVVLIVIGLIGVLAVKCETRCLLCVYLLFIILITLAFIVVWVIVQVILGSKKGDLDKICDDANQSGWLGDIQAIYPNTVCTSNPSITIGSCLNSGTSVCSGATKIQDCDNAGMISIYGDATKIPEIVYMELAKYLEEEKGCIGICSTCPHFMYSDCTKGSGAESCDKVVTDLVTDNATIVAGISAACVVIGLFIVIASFCLCCHSKFGKKTENENNTNAA